MSGSSPRFATLTVTTVSSHTAPVDPVRVQTRRSTAHTGRHPLQVGIAADTTGTVGGSHAALYIVGSPHAWVSAQSGACAHVIGSSVIVSQMTAELIGEA